jgi:2-polyprenyl-3-methyl-5-hydroxy-6-metoxy-1,4-benzoquinol methylase
MNCRLCQSRNTHPLPFEVPTTAEWFRCEDCGSDSNSLDYDPRLYTRDLAATHRANVGGREACREQVRANCEWFGHHAEGLPNRDFLDVGCADGAAIDAMQSLGWAVHGFDVAEPDYMGPHVTVAPMFHRWLFPLRYAAVLCREVLEHVPTPHLMLLELHGVTAPGGLVQVQTPRPCDYAHPRVYQDGHLFVASPRQLRTMLDAAMLDVIEPREWETGQAYLCRARV